MRSEGKRFVGGEEHIDGNEYIDCFFENVSLIYSGGELPAFERCEFDTMRMVFNGPAQRTLTMLQVMAHPESGFDRIFRLMVPEDPGAYRG